MIFAVLKEYFAGPVSSALHRSFFLNIVIESNLSLVMRVHISSSIRLMSGFVSGIPSLTDNQTTSRFTPK